MNDDLALALSLADAADAITMRHFQSSTLAVRTKSDRTPVSEADEAVEKMIRETLGRERPDDGIVGEEFGASAQTGVSVPQRRWIIDPIDATKNYVRGVPVFATLIALENEVGVVSAPALHSRWWAVRGEGAFWNGRRIHASKIDRIEDATIGYDAPDDRFMNLLRRCARSRGFGDFWTHMLVAQGGIDIAVEPQVAHWDMAAIEVIVNEAGGRFTSVDGQPRTDAGSGVSTNGVLHDEVLRMLR